MLDIIHKHGVLLDQFGIFKVFQLEQGVCYGLLRHGGIQPMQSGGKFLLVKRTVKIPFHIGAIDMAIAHVLKQFYDGIFIVSFCIQSRHHYSSLVPSAYYSSAFSRLISCLANNKAISSQE